MTKQENASMSNDYLVARQRPFEGESRSALADVLRTAVGTGAGVTIREMASLGFVVLRAGAGQKAAIDSLLGVPLPMVPLSSTSNDELCLRWVSPTEWLVTLPAEQVAMLEARLRGDLGDGVAVVDNSGGYACIHLAGPAAELVIRKSTSYDIHPRNFPAGKVVNTTFAQAQATLRRIDDQAFELIFRRSFADYIWRWLRDAAAEYGLEID